MVLEEIGFNLWFCQSRGQGPNHRITKSHRILPHHWSLVSYHVAIWGCILPCTLCGSIRTVLRRILRCQWALRIVRPWGISCKSWQFIRPCPQLTTNINLFVKSSTIIRQTYGPNHAEPHLCWQRTFLHIHLYLYISIMFNCISYHIISYHIISYHMYSICQYAFVRFVGPNMCWTELIWCCLESWCLGSVEFLCR